MVLRAPVGHEGERTRSFYRPFDSGEAVGQPHSGWRDRETGAESTDARYSLSPKKRENEPQKKREVKVSEIKSLEKEETERVCR